MKNETNDAWYCRESIGVYKFGKTTTSKGVLMNIIVAIDSFKGSLSSLQAGSAAEQGILRALPDATVSVRPVADGGEGTVAALVSGLKGKYVTISVTGTLGQPVEAT